VTRRRKKGKARSQVPVPEARCSSIRTIFTCNVVVFVISCVASVRSGDVTAVAFLAVQTLTFLQNGHSVTFAKAEPSKMPADVREVKRWITTIKSCCESQGPVHVVGMYTCAYEFTVNYSGGELVVTPGNTIEFENDALIVKGTEKPKMDSTGFKGFLADVFVHAVKTLGAAEHRILWRTISGISTAGWGR
jgi:hypothetical protein